MGKDEDMDILKNIERSHYSVIMYSVHRYDRGNFLRENPEYTEFFKTLDGLMRENGCLGNTQKENDIIYDINKTLIDKFFDLKKN